MRACLLLCLALALQAAPQQTSDFVSPVALADHMRQLAGSIASGASPELGDSWRVQSPDGAFEISTQPLLRMLHERPKPNLASAQLWLTSRADQLSNYAAVRRTSAAEGQAAMRAILARPEFEHELPPSAWERLRDAIGRWMAQVFGRLFKAVSDHTPATVMFWGLLTIALGVILWVILRRTRLQTSLHLSGTAVPLATRTWDDWILAAQTAAQAGDLRSAVQCAYWAGVTRLQASGVLPKGGTRTPREYLRLLKTQTENSPFRMLAGTLERCWYACVPATPDDYQNCLRSLEALGCRTD